MILNGVRNVIAELSLETVGCDRAFANDLFARFIFLQLNLEVVNVAAHEGSSSVMLDARHKLNFFKLASLVDQQIRLNCSRLLLFLEPRLLVQRADSEKALLFEERNSCIISISDDKLNGIGSTLLVQPGSVLLELIQNLAAKSGSSKLGSRDQIDELNEARKAVCVSVQVLRRSRFVNLEQGTCHD